MIPAIDEALFDTVEDNPTRRPGLETSKVEARSFLVKCEICKEIIAELDVANAHLPIKGSMFLSADPHHGRPAPFYPEHDWLLIRCPICRYRPFLQQDSVELADGTRYQIPLTSTAKSSIPQNEDVLSSEESVTIPKLSLLEQLKQSSDEDKSRGSAEVARVAHAHKAEGSSPSPATNKRNHHKKGGHKK